MRPIRLAVLITHPVQYFRPVFAALANDPAVELRVFFGCDHGAKPSFDPDFGVKFAWDSSPTEGFEHAWVSHRALADLSRWGVAISLALKTCRQIRRFHPDVVLVFAYTPAFITASSLLLRLAGLRLLLRADGTDRAFPRSPWKSVLKDSLLRLWYRQFAHCFPIGSDSNDHFRRLGVNGARRHPVPYAVDVDFFDRQVERWLPQRSFLRAQHQIPAEALVLLWSAKMTPVKAPKLLLQALELLGPELRQRFWLLAVGDGPLRSEFQHGAEQLLPGRALFQGFRNQSELGACYAMADALVFPSCQGETWGLVVNEALQFGLAVIASDHVGSVRDLLAPPAMPPTGSALFASEDPQAFADALRALAEAHPSGFQPQPVPSLPHPRQLAEEVSRVLQQDCNAVARA